MHASAEVFIEQGVLAPRQSARPRRHPGQEAAAQVDGALGRRGVVGHRDRRRGHGGGWRCGRRAGRRAVDAQLAVTRRVATEDGRGSEQPDQSTVTQLHRNRYTQLPSSRQVSRDFCPQRCGGPCREIGSRFRVCWFCVPRRHLLN